MHRLVQIATNTKAYHLHSGDFKMSKGTIFSLHVVAPATLAATKILTIKMRAFLYWPSWVCLDIQS